MDYDWLVIGSGFGGSVSALRLREKGYSVGRARVRPPVRRRRAAALDVGHAALLLGAAARDAGDLPAVDLQGRDDRRAAPASAAARSATRTRSTARGGASTRTRSGRAWPTGRPTLAPHYDEAERMLGRGRLRPGRPGRRPAARVRARDRGRATRTPRRASACSSRRPGERSPDPYFGGAGPDRTGCLRCGRCMVGCPHGAKNTLVKNYLWLAERAGAEVLPERMVVDVRPLGAPDGSEGYEVVTERPGAWLRRRPADVHGARRRPRRRGARHQPPAAPAGCTARSRGSPTASATSCARTPRRSSPSRCPPGAPDITRRVAITGSIYPDPDTHIETVVYGDAADSMSALYTLLVGDGTRVTRPLSCCGAAARHPVTFLRLLDPRGWSRRTIIVLVMQTLDNAIALRAAPHAGGGVRLQTEQDPERPIPTFIPVANHFAAVARAAHRRRRAELDHGGARQRRRRTAHILGGAVIGADPSRRRVDGASACSATRTCWCATAPRCRPTSASTRA